MSAGTRRPGAFSRPACLAFLSTWPARCKSSGQAVLFSPPRPPKRERAGLRVVLCHVTRSRLIAWPSSFFFSSSFPSSSSCFSLGSPAEYTRRIKSYSAENYRRRASFRAFRVQFGRGCARERSFCASVSGRSRLRRGREEGGEEERRAIYRLSLTSEATSR